VFGNLKRVINERRARNLRKPLVQWKFFVTRFTEKEVPKAQRLANEIGVDFVEFAKLLCDMSQRFFLDAQAQFENVKEWLPTDERFSAYSVASRKRKKALSGDCSSLWTRSVVNWDGSVFPCCNVFGEKWGFGNVFEEGFSAVWNNDAYQVSRERVARGKTIGKKTICHVCAENGAMQ
jgi:radical SAM protein with 4Fe4S-binding SPASM domain